MNKKMTKSQNNRVLTGTLAGIAEYFGVDPTLARVIYVFANVFLIGAPILLYILLAILIPNAKNSTRNYEHSYYQSSKSQPKQAETTADDFWGDF